MLRPSVVAATAAVVLLLPPRLAHAQVPSSPFPLPAAGHIPESVPMVPVHLNGADGLSLEMQPLRGDRTDDVDDDAWRRVCDAPCDRPLPTSGLYRVAGPDTSESDGFRLKGRDQPAILDVSPTSNAQRRAGTGLIVSGSIILGIGGLVTAVDVIVANATTGGDSSAALGVGVGGVVAGAAMLIVGLTLHTSTSVKQEPPSAAAPPPPPPAPLPSYGPPAAAAAVRLPAPSSTPLFTATF